MVFDPATSRPAPDPRMIEKGQETRGLLVKLKRGDGRGAATREARGRGVCAARVALAHEIQSGLAV